MVHGVHQNRQARHGIVVDWVSEDVLQHPNVNNPAHNKTLKDRER